MSPSLVLQNTKKEMEKAMEALAQELSRVRTGRASTHLLDDIRIDYYGTPTPLNQVGTLGVPEPRLITIAPWDSSAIALIEKAISSSDLGLTPSNDGKLVRIPIPALTEERRRDLVKLVKKYGEESKVSIRHHRREALDALKRLEKSKEISEDDFKQMEKEIQKITDSFVEKVDQTIAHKEKELMEV